MATVTISEKIVQTVTIGTTAATIASAGFLNFGTAGVINNVPVDGTTVAGDVLDLFVNFGSAVTTGAGAPNLAAALVPSQDGTNYVSPGTSSIAMPSLADYAVKPLAAAAAVTSFKIPDIPVGPYKNLLLIQNNTGTFLPIGVVVIAVVKTIENW